MEEEEEKDPFGGLGWEVELVRLVDLHVPFNLLLEYGVSGAK